MAVEFSALNLAISSLPRRLLIHRAKELFHHITPSTPNHLPTFEFDVLKGISTTWSSICTRLVALFTWRNGKPPRADLVAQAEAKGYQRGAHKERDQIRHREKHVTKTKRDQDTTLKRYVL
jgi:hypothetical protein